MTNSLEPVRLNADQLWARWGFGDGEMIDHYLEAWGIDQVADIPAGRHAERRLGRAVLIELVERFLLPQLPEPIPVSVIDNGHNPITFDDDSDYGPTKDMAPAWARNFSVEVSLADVYRTICLVWGDTPPADRFGDGIRPPPEIVLAEQACRLDALGPTATPTPTPG